LRKLLAPAFVAAALTAAPAASAAPALTAREIVNQVSPSVARISIRDAKGKEVGNGSGFVISADGQLVTNHHVVNGASGLVAAFADGKEAEVVGIRSYDSKIDIAVLQLKPGAYAPLTLATVPAERGDDVVVVGSPLGLTQSVSKGIVANVFTRGTVRKRNDHGLEDWGLHMTADVSSGSSGSPIFNTNAEVVGVVVGKSNDGALSLGVPVDWFQSLLAPPNADAVPLKLIAQVQTGPPVRTNLLISAGVFGAIALAWWVASWRSRRRAARVVTRGWR
jgi:S1-C subfamily serine protease